MACLSPLSSGVTNEDRENLISELEKENRDIYLAREMDYMDVVGHTDIVEFLFNTGVDSNIRTSWTPLHVAVHQHQTETVQFLLNRGAYIDAKTCDGVTALHMAAENSNKKITELLLEKGATIDITTIKGQCPLHIAARNGQESIVELLLNKGANIDAEDKKGQTPLTVAVAYQHKNIATLLLSRGALVGKKSLERFSSLNLAVVTDNKDIVELLLDNGLNIYVTNEYRETALHVAAQNGCKEIIELLINKGIDIDARDVGGFTALMMCYNVECSKIIIKYTLLLNHDAPKPDFIVNELSEYWNYCKQELKKVVGSNDIPLHEFLQEANVNKLANYVSNAGIQKKLLKAEIFPVYASIIKDQINKGEERKCLLYKSNIVMEHCDLKTLPEEIRNKISISLTNVDLKNLIKSVI